MLLLVSFAFVSRISLYIWISAIQFSIHYLIDQADMPEVNLQLKRSKKFSPFACSGIMCEVLQILPMKLFMMFMFLKLSLAILGYVHFVQAAFGIHG